MHNAYYYSSQGEEGWLGVVKLRSEEKKKNIIIPWEELSDLIQRFILFYVDKPKEVKGSILFVAISTMSSRNTSYYARIEELVELHEKGILFEWNSRSKDLVNFKAASISLHWRNSFKKLGMSEEECISSSRFRRALELENLNISQKN